MLALVWLRALITSSPSPFTPISAPAPRRMLLRTSRRESLPLVRNICLFPSQLAESTTEREEAEARNQTSLSSRQAQHNRALKGAKRHCPRPRPANSKRRLGDFPTHRIGCIKSYPQRRTHTQRTHARTVSWNPLFSLSSRHRIGSRLPRAATGKENSRLRLCAQIIAASPRNGRGLDSATPTPTAAASATWRSRPSRRGVIVAVCYFVE